MKPTARISIFLISVVLLVGCATGWGRVDDSGRYYKGKYYNATLPLGWMRMQSGETLTLSRDGIDLQRIVIEYRPHDKAFEGIEKSSSESMLPSELAELTIAELKASQDEGWPSLEVLVNEPVKITGHTGYGLHLRFKTDEGLRIDVLLRGFVDEDGLYLVMYRAPTLHYFERDRTVYESIAGSLKL